MMKYVLLPFLLAATSAWSQSKEKTFNLLVGTYTKPGKSDGIYVYRFNATTGELIEKSAVKGIKNPSFLTVSKDRKFVYAANETSEGKVSAFKFDQKTGGLTLLNAVTSGGNGPCYVSTDDRGRFVFVGNYGGGSVSAIRIKSDGSLDGEVQTIQHEGKSKLSNQEMPHVHATVMSKDNQFLFVPDLGTDKVNIYRVNYSNSKPLVAANPPFVSVEPGNGPRHITLDPSGKRAFLIQEMTGIVTAYTVADGRLEAQQSLSLAPAGFNGTIDAADIHCSPDGKFLYASLRGDINEIVTLSIDRTGLMTYSGRHSVQGKIPRNFAIDPTGNFLLVANQSTDEIVVFRRDAKTGSLHAIDKKISIGSPVCLVFTEE